jgi:hypothetical protein
MGTGFICLKVYSLRIVDKDREICLAKQEHPLVIVFLSASNGVDSPKFVEPALWVYQEPLDLWDISCHGSNQNQPPKVESKPASLRRGCSYHFCCVMQEVWLGSELNEQGARLRALARAPCGRRFVGLRLALLGFFGGH